MSVENFIDALESGDYKSAEQEFKAELQSRTLEAIDARRVEVGQAISQSMGASQAEE